MSKFHPVLPMRAAFVACIAAVLGILALANLSSTAPLSASAGKSPSVRAPIALAARGPIALADR